MPPWTALEAIRLIDGGEMSAIEVFDAYAAEIERRNAELSVFQNLDLDRARAGVRARSHLPLRGLPVAIKDVIETEDMPTTYGSPIYAGHRPAADAAIVARLRALGASIVGKTVTTEFAYFHPGPTRNPHDPERTPGGSSSGSAAAVAAGMAAFALGTQTAGSTLRPASYCGVVGLKPSFGLLPTAGVKPLAPSFDTIGIFAASVEDTAFLLSRLAGEASTPLPPSSPSIGLVRTHHWDEASPAMQAALLAAAERAAAAGADVEDAELPEPARRLHAAHPRFLQYEAGKAFVAEHRDHRDLLSEPMREMLDGARDIDTAEYDAMVDLARDARASMRPLFDRFDFLLTPAAPDIAPLGIHATGSPSFNRLWTALHGPAVSIPLAQDRGLPLGIQLVGAPGADAALLRRAAGLAELP